MPDPITAPDTPPALDEDLYCFTCGYNLRGLPGDPVRCPECFDAFSRTLLRARIRIRVVTRLERMRRNLGVSGDLCALGLVPALFGVYGLAWGSITDREFYVSIGETGGVIWLLGFGNFARICWRLPGWAMAFAK